MKGKIDNTGWLYKEDPNGKMQACACCVDRSEFCHWSCVAFDGPLPILECTENPASSLCPKDCNGCQYLLPSGKMTIKICQGRELVFDEFVDERVPK